MINHANIHCLLMFWHHTTIDMSNSTWTIPFSMCHSTSVNSYHYAQLSQCTPNKLTMFRLLHNYLSFTFYWSCNEVCCLYIAAMLIVVPHANYWVVSSFIFIYLVPYIYFNSKIIVLRLSYYHLMRKCVTSKLAQHYQILTSELKCSSKPKVGLPPNLALQVLFLLLKMTH